ncbi:MAG: M14 family zinc carboxypeptidase [Thiohalospira sp.]
MKSLNQNFLKFFMLISFALILSIINPTFVYSQKIQTPTEHFGFYPGTDKMLFNYESLISYLNKLDEASDKVAMRQIGLSPMGKPMYVMFISSAENIQNLEKLKQINEELALNPNLTEKEQKQYINEGKVFFLFTLSMHSTEVAPSQSLPLIAYELVTTTDEAIQKQLNDVVYMVVPNHNPDGMNMVVDHYNKYKDTKYDGASMPGVYHKYVGHDNNRDFVALTQSDTRAISKLYSKEWFPQVMVEKHQMGSTGPRYFVSPPHDPIAENVDAGIWNWMKIFGSRTVTKMTEEGLKGVSQNYLFDDYWPGATETCIWKNVVGMLTEAASVKYATPIYVEPTELQAVGKGMGEYKKSINMTDPWEGGWWRLSDLIKYEVSSTMAYLETAAMHKKEILKFRNDLCKKEVEKGKNEAPYYYVFSKNQHDQSELVSLVNLLNEHGVNVYELDKSVIAGQKTFNKGDIIVPLAQPFRPFIKEMLESQVFPARHYTPNGEMIKPYDITSWSLPLHKGVKVFEINKDKKLFDNSYTLLKQPYNLFTPSNSEYEAILLTANHNNSYQAVFAALNNGIKVEQILEDYNQNGIIAPKGSFIVYSSKNFDVVLNQLNFTPEFIGKKLNVKTKSVSLPRIAIIESYFHHMDAGWTRYVFDSYNIPFTVLNPDEIKNTDLSKKFDVIVIPDEQKSVLIDGSYKSESRQYFMKYPPEYMKGMEKEGYEKLLKFIHDGGNAIAWRDATELFSGMQSVKADKNTKEDFEFPVRDISDGLIKNGFSSPGSLLKVELNTDHPITYGMTEEVGVFHRSSPIFTTWQPYFDVDRRVVGIFPERNILLSGYAENEEKLGNKASIVWLKKGRGQVVLFSFNPQFRASTPATYKLLFNSLLL